MKRLVDDFLDVSAIEAGKLELELRSASLRDALEYALTLNDIQAGKKGIELRVRCEDGLPSVSMDASKIEQVITNLVSNAIEHTSPDSPVIIALTSDRQSVVFSVEDRGRGIPPEERDGIFEPFATSAARKTGGERGTGLGLLISRKIIEAHGGQIWLDSEPGNGTRIHFSLPLRGDGE
jgi:signal transduction histidine kinase